MIVPIYAKISKNKIKTFNAYTLPKVHQLGGITRHTPYKRKTSPTPPMPNLPLKSSIALTSWQSVMALKRRT
jgi:hypothetical protein